MRLTSAEIDTKPRHEDQLLAEERQGEVLESTDLSESFLPNGKKYYIESYGCQMNFSDSEIVASILRKEGFALTKNFEDANLILLNTCSIREKAEETIRKRLQSFRKTKADKDTKIGVLGCMAERLKKQLLEEEKLVDIVCGPDAYRDLPNLFYEAETGQKAVNVLLSREETYADIAPIRLDSNGVSAFISIMRGCDNMCSFCVVPFTRGRERSRNANSIVAEAQDLFDRGYREVTLLGQNVDSYKWKNKEDDTEKVNFAKLIEMVAQVHPDLRVRFSTSHPKDMTDEVLEIIAKYENICNYIHLPLQSGNTRVLDKMNRTYTREWYINRIDAIRRIIPNCAISSDIICGFCSETEEEHAETLSMMEYVKYDMNYMFFYSERPGTLAERKFEDDIPLAVKKRRLTEVIQLQGKHSLERNQETIGKTYKVLVEKVSKRSEDDLCGRTDGNKMVIFAKGNLKPNMYVDVKITECTSASLKGEVVGVYE